MEPMTAVPEQEQEQNEQEPTLVALTDAEALRDAVYPQKIGAPRKATLPILTHLQLRADDAGRLWVGWTDMDLWSEVEVERADVETPGAICAPVQNLYKILNAIPKKERAGVPVMLQADGDKMHMTVGTVEYDLYGLSADEFPGLAETPERAGTVPMETVLTWTRRVAEFASTEDSRPILQGVHLAVNGDDPRVEATNGHYAMTYRGDGLADLGNVDAILPTGLLEHARRIFDKDDTIRVEVGHADDDGRLHRIVLRGPGGYIAGRVIEGPYMHLQQVHPAPGTHVLTATLDDKELKTVLKCLDPVASSHPNHRIQVTPEPENGRVIFSTDTPDLGTASGPVTADVEIHADSIKAGMSYLKKQTDESNRLAVPFTFGLNLKYLQAIRKALTADRIRVEVWHPERAILLRDADDPTLTALLMPLRFYT